MVQEEGGWSHGSQAPQIGGEFVWQGFLRCYNGLTTWMIVREEGEGTLVSPHTSALILASSSSSSSRASRVGPSPGGLILRISQLSRSKVAVRCGASNSFKMNFLYLVKSSRYLI